MKLDQNGLFPVIIQHELTKDVLMLGYMNEETLKITLNTKKVTFFSRSRNEIWTKGETSGNYLNYVYHEVDCDEDTILIKALPEGPTCHRNTFTCFNDTKSSDFSVLEQLISTIDNRFTTPKEGSYIQSLIDKGLPKIAQKVGEEGVEIVIEAMRNEPELFKEEAADLLFHYLVLLRAKDVDFSDILEVLKKRVK
jgi:phosphoribosyl-ATP pyrophosphohydrolase/phosphoribosyl-AMP cyclohydrolase